MESFPELSDAEIATINGGGAVDDAVDWINKVLRDYLNPNN